jgi:hypothetical protein
MTRKSNRLWLLRCGLFLFAATALSQEPFNWLDNPPPTSQFATALNKIFDAALEEPVPFESIKGRFDPEHSSFSAKVLLPGILPEYCGLDQSTANRTWEYICKLSWQEAASRSEPASAMKIYVNLTNLVQDSRKDWDITPYRKSSFFSSVAFGVHKEIRYREILISRQNSSVTLTVFLPLCKSHCAASPSGPSPPSVGIDSEINSVIQTGHYVGLPAPQASRGSLPGVTTLAITNGTTYDLRIVTSGPTSAEYSIPAGQTQEVQVVPGLYKVFGKVSDPNVLPFYGGTTYESGTKYVYRFYI